MTWPPAAFQSMNSDHWWSMDIKAIVEEDFSIPPYLIVSTVTVTVAAGIKCQ